MRQTITKLLGSALTLLFLVPSVASATITAKWDWKNNTPDGIRSISAIQSTTGTVTSNVDGILMFVDATSGKLAPNGDNAQFNSGTILRIPVVSTLDVVTFTPHSSGYNGVTIGDDDYSDTSGTERTHTATAAEVQQGYVQITSKGGYLYGIQVELAYMPPTQTIAKWDWKNNTPDGIRSISAIQNTTGTVTSNVDGILMFVDATSGKLAPNGDNAQFNSGTTLRVPVTSTSDVVTVYYHPSGFTKVTIGGNDYNTQKTDYIATAADVTQGYVEVVSGGGYLYSITLTKGNFTTASIGSYKWATYSYTSATDFTSLAGVVDAYQVKGNAGTAITKESVKTAAANTGLLLNGEAGTYAIPLATTGTDLSSTNKLVAVTSATTISAAESGYTNYVLSVANDKAVFKYIGSTSANVGAGKAYLKLNISDPASAPTFLSLDFDSETTDISEKVIVNSEKSATTPVYNLAGQRVAQPKKGLYIVNGKKVVIK